MYHILINLLKPVNSALGFGYQPRFRTAVSSSIISGEADAGSCACARIGNQVKMPE